jgi:tetratricopeptide (TPR) repeat protein
MVLTAIAALLFGSAAADTIPLYDDLGNHHHAVTTASPLAQKYFDQGLRFAYAFDHGQSVASFQQAARIDAECAMCWWGVAFASGPNINAPMDSAAGVVAYDAVRRAVALAPKVTAQERAYIDAIAKRYGAEPLKDRAQRDTAFARAMGEVARAYPGDDDALTIWAEALMDLTPWTYWTKAGAPLPGTEDMTRALETVTERNLTHAGACHLYIHAVEAAHPKRAEPCADRLAGLMPGAGHIVHMPGHIYIRVGRWADAINANHHAIHADDEDVADRNPNSIYAVGYMPHNHHFLHFAAMMAGDRELSLSTAWDLAKRVNPDMMASLGFLQLYSEAPLLTQLRYEQWNAVLASPKPQSGLPYPTGLWHFARGTALARKGEVREARTELDALARVAKDTSLGSLYVLGYNSAAQLLVIHRETLAGEIAAARGDMNTAEQHFRNAISLEDDLVYIEPPEIDIPPRQHFAFALLRAGRAKDAETVFRQDLDRFAENVWSLDGLATSLERQGRIAEANRVRMRVQNSRMSSATHHGR